MTVAGMSTIEVALACLAAFFALAFAAAVAYLFRVRNAADEGGGENLRQRLADKEEACRRLLEAKDAACAQALAEKDHACAKLLAEKETACAKLLAEKDAMLTRNFAETVKALREQFAVLAAKALKSQSADLTELNKTHLETVLKPLREQMGRLQDATVKAESARANLGQAITKDVDAIGRIAKELSGVATALRSNTRVQGRSGEDILAEKLRQAGLEENVNFFLQRGTGSDRPDAQVCDTENRWLVIDSKVSLTAYMEYMDAEDDATKAEKLAAHVASVRGKIDQLAKKRYPKVLSEEFRDRNYLPITAMFVPYEAPLMEALRADPSIWQFAAQNNVVLITPLTLLAYIRLVYLAWQHEKEARNQREIVDAARELLARMNSFLLTFERLGHAIGSLQDEYEKARTSLVDAPRTHTIAKAAKRLIDLHVRLENSKGKKLEQAECLKEQLATAGDEYDGYATS